jgi:hypothetical protein
MIKRLIQITAAITAASFLMLAAQVALAESKGDTISIRFAQVECSTRNAQNLAQLIEIVMTCDEKNEARKQGEASLRNSVKGN